MLRFTFFNEPNSKKKAYHSPYCCCSCRFLSWLELALQANNVMTFWWQTGALFAQLQSLGVLKLPIWINMCSPKALGSWEKWIILPIRCSIFKWPTRKLFSDPQLFSSDGVYWLVIWVKKQCDHKQKARWVEYAPLPILAFGVNVNHYCRSQPV